MYFLYVVYIYFNCMINSSRNCHQMSIWILFNGCPWTKAMAKNDDEEFILDILRYFKPNLSRRQCNNIIGLVLTFILLISYYKLLYHCDLKK